MQSEVEESYRVGDRVALESIGIGTIASIRRDRLTDRPVYSVTTLSRITDYGSLSLTYQNVDERRLSPFSTDRELRYLEKIKRLAYR